MEKPSERISWDPEVRPTVSHAKGLRALSPILVFVVLYLVTSIAAGDFYKMPVVVAFLFSAIYAIAVSTRMNLSKRIETFSRGAGSPNMMLMLWIFILAGAFASTAKAMGSVDATVAFTIRLLPPQLLLAGLFTAACLVSLSIGTSVGTIVALVPIAAGIAQSAHTDCAFTVAIVVGGAFFGDNLSFISDTTVAATSSQGCRMSDKFKVNAYIAFPAAIAVMLLYIFLASPSVESGASVIAPDASLLPAASLPKLLPYIAVLLFAILGMNVMAVLVIGIAITGIVGIADGSYDVYGWMQQMGNGITGMGELIIITMLAGGLLETVKANGGIDYIMSRLSGHVNDKRKAELTIASMVSLVNVCTANNTVAIITVGGIAKQIGDRFGVDNRKAASILDTFSCAVQGLLPYGAQVLMAGTLASVNPVHIVPYLYYPMTIGIFAIIAIVFRLPRRYS